MRLSQTVLRYFAKFIEDETAIVYSDVNFYQLESRLDEIAPQLNFKSADDLYQHAVTKGIDAALKLLLLDTATNNETLFFRDNSVFLAIATIMSQWSQTNPKTPLRIWSAACSTGQEVYSLAMLAAEQRLKTPDFSASIFASDLSERVLKRAKEGRYSQLEVQRGLSASRLIRYFEQTPDKDNIATWQAKPELKANVTFRSINLIAPWLDLGTFDLILCRNVLIYQNVESKSKVIAKLFRHLSAGGHLILGGAESIIGLSKDFEFHTICNTMVYRRPELGLASA